MNDLESPANSGFDAVYHPDLLLDSPYLDAAGSLGFVPPATWLLEERLGAFITHPVSARPRKPSAQRAALTFPGGCLIHSGLPNPGLRTAIQRHSARWSRSAVPVWVHIIPSDPGEAGEMVARLEEVEGVSAIELGLPPDSPADRALSIIHSALGELPLVVAVPLHRWSEPWVSRLPELSISALTLSAPRGVMPDDKGQLRSGRLMGPALFPQALAALVALRSMEIPIILGAGIYRRADALKALESGARAVQIDAALWRGGLA